MYAVIETGGKQVRIKEGDTVRVERLAAAPGDEVTLDRVLLVGNGTTQIGAPVLAGAMVKARVVRQGRGRKLRVMKYKAKAHYRRRQGHRQAFTELRIEKIDLSGAQAVSQAVAAGETPTAADQPARAPRTRRRKRADEGKTGGS